MIGTDGDPSLASYKGSVCSVDACTRETVAIAPITASR